LQEATRLLIARHGETLWNTQSRIQGHTDIGLNDHGRWQAERLAQALRDETIVACYASDLSRARDTAAAVASHHRLPVHTDPGLRERCFGRFEAHVFAELEGDFPAETLAWRKRVPDFAPEGGESLLQLRERTLGALNAIAARHPGEQILVVAHGGVLDIFYRAATGLDLQAPRSWDMGNATINRLLWTPESLTLVGWGDRSHLEADPTLDETSA
jgi:2,3-bisphosphoglycerate-dependent phosphoglycerate mutase